MAHSDELTAAVATCTRSSRPGIDRVDDLQAPTLTEELLAANSCWGREAVAVAIVRFPTLYWMPHTHAHIDGTNWT